MFVQDALKPKRLKKSIDFKDLFWEKFGDCGLYAKDPETGYYYSPDAWAHWEFEQQQTVMKTSFKSASAASSSKKMT